MKLQNSHEAWIQYLANSNAKLVPYTDPITGESTAIIRRSKGGSDRHLLGTGTRKMVVQMLLDKYGSVDAVNREILKKQ